MCISEIAGSSALEQSRDSAKLIEKSAGGPASERGIYSAGARVCDPQQRSSLKTPSRCQAHPTGHPQNFGSLPIYSAADAKAVVTFHH